mgnify:CR=1 FL=1|jgi:riboflavin synthase|tara:strand:- start:950 stop:1537 length:588 start_codon:yes stop_codon:yes gene_type:complete
MFNGIIFHTGVIKSIKKEKKSLLISIRSNLKVASKDIGSSICCDGVCLTLSKIKSGLIFFYISVETLKRSTFSNAKIGQIVNLEKSLLFGQYISGHFVQGHVDTVAKVKKISFIDKSWLLRLKLLKKNLDKFIEEKASITINGVSLTISKVTKDHFDLNIIPHTLKLTNLKNLKTNDTVNVELDIFGKYIYKYNH